MNRKIILCIFSLGLFLQSQAQLTPLINVPLKSTLVEVPPKFKSVMPGTYRVNLPDGWAARIYYAGGLAKPRFLSFDGKGVLHVADYTNGKVYAMIDLDANGIADTALVAADNLSLSHDVKFYNGDMYVTQERSVLKLTDNNKDGIYEQRVVFIDSIAAGAAQPGGGHRTRTIVFDSIHQKVYLSIGSLCNVCREDFRAVIEEYNINGKGKKIFATGVRNAVGMTMHPITHQLWANNNGSDRQGSQIPPEWYDIIREKGFYGYPFAYGNKTYFDFNAHPDYQALLPITSVDSAKVNTLVFPAAQLEAHSAPMALTFLNNSFPVQMQNGMITALRGSWDSPKDYRGYKLSYIHFNNSADTTADNTSDFCTGFLTDTVNRLFWARPVGLAINQHGSIFMSSDEGNRFIMEIYQTNPTGLIQPSELNQVKLFPNPAHDFLTIKTSQNLNSLEVFDLLGKKIALSFSKSNDAYEANTSNMEPGFYMCKMNDGHQSVFAKFQIIH